MERLVELAAINLNEKDLELIKNRLCCPNDKSSLFTIAAKNINDFNYKVVCKKCHTNFEGHNK